jgi:hypothetical protein
MEKYAMRRVVSRVPEIGPVEVPRYFSGEIRKERLQRSEQK